MKSWSRLDWLIIIIFAALVTLFYWRILTPNLADRQSFPPGDFHAQFWAFSTFEVRELSAGRLPLWNPYTFAGAPFWADVQSAVFYPVSLLTILLSAPWGFSLFALEIEAIFHIWLAAVFMFLFIRDLTASRAAAVIAALTFTFSGYLTGYPSQQLAVLEADVWLPLILFFLHRAGSTWQVETRAEQQESGPGTSTFQTPSFLRGSYSKSSVPSLVLAGAAWGLTLLAGHPQSALIVIYVSSAYFLFLWLPAHHPLQRSARLPRLALHYATFLITGLALAAIQFIPAVEYTLLSVRAEGTYENMSGGFPLIDIIQLLLPGQVSFFSPLYIGITSLILAIWVIFTAPNRHTIFWAVLAVVALVISFGGNTFFYSPLYLSMPGFSIFRGQERWAFATIFSLSVLTGYGFRTLLDQQFNLEIKALSTLTKTLFFFALLLTFLFFFGLNDTGWSPNSPFFNLLGAATLLTVLLALTWSLWIATPKLPPLALTLLAAGLICLDLFTVNWQTNLYPQQPTWHTQMPALVDAVKKDAAQNPDEPYRVYNEFRLYDNYGIPYEIEDLWGASPLRPDRYDQILAPPMPIERTWELLNVKYVVTWRQELFVPSTIIYQEPAGDETTFVHRLQEIGPRAWLVTQAKYADDATILQNIADPGFNRWQTALLENNMAPRFDPDPSLSDAQLQAGRIARTVHHASHLSYQVETNTPALLMLSEPHYPGWQATIDGNPAPLLRANFVLQAVPVPLGQHKVDLIFRPHSFTIGAVISAVSLLFITLAMILPLKRNRPPNYQLD